MGCLRGSLSPPNDCGVLPPCRLGISLKGDSNLLKSEVRSRLDCTTMPRCGVEDASLGNYVGTYFSAERALCGRIRASLFTWGRMWTGSRAMKVTECSARQDCVLQLTWSLQSNK